MQLGWAWRSDDTELRRVWLHEFGHALGFWHEHETPIGIAEIPWDFDGVARWCDAHEVSMEEWRSVWQTPVAMEVIEHRHYDPDSIMGYYIPPEWVLDRVARGGANVLSWVDRALARGWYGMPPVKWHRTLLPIVEG